MGASEGFFNPLEDLKILLPLFPTPFPTYCCCFASCPWSGGPLELFLSVPFGLHVGLSQLGMGNVAVGMGRENPYPALAPRGQGKGVGKYSPTLLSLSPDEPSLSTPQLGLGGTALVLSLPLE